jgi:ATP-dependent HslUV protease ATP-binding subunit HslU
MQTEGVTLDITDDAVAAVAATAADVNSTVENIGARRLQTVMERMLDEISFSAPDRNGEASESMGLRAKNISDLAETPSRFIL